MHVYDIFPVTLYNLTGKDNNIINIIIYMYIIYEMSKKRQVNYFKSLFNYKITLKTNYINLVLFTGFKYKINIKQMKHLV